MQAIRALQERTQSDNVSASFFPDYADRPVDFCRDHLGLTRLWYRQREIIESAWQEVITGAISGQKTGKTLGAAAAAITWVATKPNGIVRLASASSDQLKDGVWGEVRRLLQESPHAAEWPEANLDPATGWRVDAHRKIIGVTAKEANRMAGRSGAEQLWVVDEACGLPYALWEVILGNLMGGGHLLWLTNPVTIGSKVYEWVTKPDSSARIIQIDSRETPNFPGTKDYTGELIPGLADPDGVAMIADDYGEDSAEFDVRVRGKFPRQGGAAIISLDMVEDAIARYPDTSARGSLVIGVDVARYGDDDSVAVPTRGQVTYDPRVWHGLDEVTLSAKILELALELRIAGESVTLVIDEAGLGQGVVDILLASSKEQRWCDWISVIPVMVGASASDEEQYVNKRSELWFRGREWLKEGGALPANQRLKGELISVQYGFDTRQRRRVESKDEIKKRTHYSPDVADAWLLSLEPSHRPVRVAEMYSGMNDSGSRWGDYDGRGF